MLLITPFMNCSMRLVLFQWSTKRAHMKRMCAGKQGSRPTMSLGWTVRTTL